MDLARLFPTLEFVVYSTFSSTRDTPRWRAFIPTTTRMAAPIYRIITDQLVQALNDEGYWTKGQIAANATLRNPKTHGLDLGKLAASSLFRLPAQSKDKGASFFHQYEGDKRKTLDPFTWIDWGRVPPNSNTQAPLRMTSNLSEDAMEQRKAQAIADWRSTPEGEGNQAFFKLGARLWAAGFQEWQVESVLTSQLQEVKQGSRADRRGQIRDIISWLRVRAADWAA